MNAIILFVGLFFSLVTQAGTLTFTSDETSLFYSYGEINGQKAIFMIDTGASHLTMNIEQAMRLKLDVVKKGVRVNSSTASGDTPAWAMNLDEVKLGENNEIVLKDVKALIMENDHPTTILLGMTFLSRVKMCIHDSTIEFTQ